MRTVRRNSTHRMDKQTDQWRYKMNTRFSFTISALLIVAIVLIAACTTPGTGASPFDSPIAPTPEVTTTPGSRPATATPYTPPPTPPLITTDDVDLSFEVADDIRAGKAGTIIITVKSRLDMPEAMVILSVRGPNVNHTSEPRSLGDLKAKQPIRITDTLLLPDEAEYYVKIHLYTPYGFHDNYGQSVLVTKSGVIINPTPVYGPGTPVPAVPDKTKPSPTPSSLSGGATPTPFETSSDPEYNPAAANAPTGTVTLSGRIWFVDRDSVQRDGKYMRIEVWDWESGGDQFLGATETNAQGNWSFGPITNSDLTGN